MFQTKLVEKIKTHILCLITFPDNLWDKVEKYCTVGQATGDNMIRYMRCASWIIKATNTHSEYVMQ